MVDQAQLLGDKTQRLDGNVHGGVHWTVISMTSILLPPFTRSHLPFLLFLFLWNPGKYKKNNDPGSTKKKEKKKRIGTETGL